MASIYSNLKIQLMTTGENSTTWGNVTNINLGTALEEAIAGSADVTFANANVTLTLTDTNATQSARNMRLNLTGNATTGYSLTVPAIEKAYIINNATDGTVTVKNATGANVAVPTGKTTWVYNTGSNVVDAVTHLTSLSVAGGLTLGTALPVTSGGTGSNLTTFCNVQTNVVGTLPLLNGGTGGTTQATARSGIGAAASGANGDITSLTALTSIPTGTTINGVVIGYLSIPRSTTTTTAVVGDVGKCIAVTAGITIPNSTFTAGDAVSIYNDSAAAITITAGVTTLRLAGSATTGNRTLAARGMATVWFNSATEAIISGAGVS